MNSRAIGDFDVGDYLLPSPFVIQLRLPTRGARLMLASDGVWDAFKTDRVAKIARKYPTASATGEVVTRVARSQGGLKDDTTLICIDVLPPGAIWPEIVNSIAGKNVRPSKHTVQQVQSSGGCCGGKR
jgi:integrin-linked kinase-associated serine/threonine phosphatase 2C